MLEILKTNSESSFLNGFNDTDFSSQGLFWAEQSNNSRGAFQHQKLFVIVSSTFNDSSSAQDRPRELILVSLELSGNEDSENVCEKKTATQNL